jgi:hypothetical protein
MNRYAPTDETPKRYAQALTAARTLFDLTEAAKAFAYIADDALQIVLRMKVEEFSHWRAGLDMERRGMFAGEMWNARYGAVLMPAVMLQVTMIAQHFGVPWGSAFNRCADTGIVVERNGVAVWKGAKHGS